MTAAFLSAEFQLTSVHSKTGQSPEEADFARGLFLVGENCLVLTASIIPGREGTGSTRRGYISEMFSVVLSPSHEPAALRAAAPPGSPLPSPSPPLAGPRSPALEAVGRRAGGGQRRRHRHHHLTAGRRRVEEAPWPPSPHAITAIASPCPPPTSASRSPHSPSHVERLKLL